MYKEKLESNNYTGTINIGFQKRYTGKYFKKEDYLLFIKKWQLERTADHKLMFCPAVFEFDFVCGNLTEKHAAIRFVNYPKSIVTKKEFRKIVLSLAKIMGKEFSQNRVLVEFTDRNILLEATEEYDSKIK